MKFRRPGRMRFTETALDLTSMSDMVFLLLIFLLLSTTFKSQERAFTITLPTASHDEVLVAPERTTVYVTRKGEIHVVTVAAGATSAAGAETEQLTLEQLETRLRAVVASKPDAVISIEAHRDAPYQFVVDVVGRCYGAGVHRVLLPYQLSSPDTPAGNLPPAVPAVQ